MKQPYEGIAYVIALARAEAERMEQQYLRALVTEQVRHGYGDLPSLGQTAKYQKIEAVNIKAQLLAAVMWIEQMQEQGEPTK